MSGSKNDPTSPNGDDTSYMNNKTDLTEGSVIKVLVKFALPYLFSCFLQTFYGMADLFIVGAYNGKEVTAAVSIGSQVTHMITVIIVGLTMGITVHSGAAAGAKNSRLAKRIFGTAISFFAAVSLVITAASLLLCRQITTIMLTPAESFEDTAKYLAICFCGIPFIAAFNVISGLFRGFGNSKKPMYFVAAACIVNVVLDIVLIGKMHLGAVGAALATVIGQAASAAMAVASYKSSDLGFTLSRKDLKPDKAVMKKLLGVGIPISLQDGFVQVAFTIIIVIANSRGLVFSTAVGIVEKIIGFMFLVPSSFLSSISAVTAQNIGAGKHKRATVSLFCGIAVTCAWGILCCAFSNATPQALVGLFTKDADVIAAGGLYLQSYSFDCIFAAVHFCFSGYFCGSDRSYVSFIHNVISIILIRIPGAFAASIYYPETLYPMGWAAPIGSLLSALICVIFFVYFAYHKHSDMHAGANTEV